MGMFKIKKEDKIFDIFKILLSKLPRNPTNIEVNEIVSMYKRAVEITDTVDGLESIYLSEGKIEL